MLCILSIITFILPEKYISNNLVQKSQFDADGIPNKEVMPMIIDENSEIQEKESKEKPSNVMEFIRLKKYTKKTIIG